MVDFTKYYDEPAGSAPEEFVPPVGTYTGVVAKGWRGVETAKGGVLISVPLVAQTAGEDVDPDVLPNGAIPPNTRVDATFLVSEDFGRRQRDDFLRATGVDLKGLTTKEALDAAVGAPISFYVNKHREMDDGRKVPNVSKFFAVE